MKKTALEKIIEKQATDRFNQDWQKIERFITDSPILSRIKVTLPDGEEEYLVESGGYGRQVISTRSTHINYENVKKVVIEKYIEEETTNILNKLSNLNYLFNQ